MILYGIKYQGKYLRDKGETGIELLNLDHASVFSNREAAEKLRDKFGASDQILVEFTLTEAEIKW